MTNCLFQEQGFGAHLKSLWGGTGNKPLVEMFGDVDDFCRFCIPQWKPFCLKNRYRLRRRQDRMYPSETITIRLFFHLSYYCDFKIWSCIQSVGT
ncbi:hypothetical protein IDH36_17405 [Xenorhabdus griffiniae]|nr:hypothetical protein [Xenorhabdus griffiniae]